MKRAQLRKKLGNQARRKSLPRGNMKFVGNEAGRRERERHPINAGVVMGNGRGGVGYVLPVSSGLSVTAEKQSRGEPVSVVRKGFESAALPLEGPPGSEWWNNPEFKNRRR